MTGQAVSGSNSVELAAVHVTDVAGELGDGALHAQTHAEERHLVLAAVADGLDLALDAALAEAAGDDDPVGRAEALGDRLRRELFGVSAPSGVEPSLLTRPSATTTVGAASMGTVSRCAHSPIGSASPRPGMTGRPGCRTRTR